MNWEQKSIRQWLLAVCCLFSVLAPVVPAEARNIILMVPDGMGSGNITAARIYKGGNDGASLNLETLGYIGYQMTHSLNSTITDSAAGSSAWASGEKFNNGEISCHDANHDGACDGTRTNLSTVLEISKASGLSTGLVVTSGITHATPAAFGAHVFNRHCEADIFDQYINNTAVDILLGGGVGVNNNPACKYGQIDGRHIPADYSDDGSEQNDSSNGLDYATAIRKFIDDTVQPAQAGYTEVTTADELNRTVSNGSSKIWGHFGKGITDPLTPEYLKGVSNAEPTLAAMTQAALSVLENNSTGFFLMVEGSQIDWASHAMNLPYQIREIMAFDEAVKTVLDWMDKDRGRPVNTLLIVVADHETGGFMIQGPAQALSEPGDSKDPLLLDSDGNVDLESGTVTALDQDGNTIYLPNLTPAWAWSYGQGAAHTAGDTVIWSNNPSLGRSLDNTDLFTIMTDWLAR